MFERLKKIIKSKPFKNAARKTSNVIKIILAVYFIPVVVSVILIPIIHEWFFVLFIIMYLSTYPFSQWLIKVLR